MLISPAPVDLLAPAIAECGPNLARRRGKADHRAAVVEDLPEVELIQGVFRPDGEFPDICRIAHRNARVEKAIAADVLPGIALYVVKGVATIVGIENR